MHLFTPLSAMFSPHQAISADTAATFKCPFCGKGGYKKLGNHLPSCKERNGRDYSIYLSSKSLKKKASSLSKVKCKFCPRCHKRFQRIDTHLRNSAVCRSIPQEVPVEASSDPVAGCSSALSPAAESAANESAANESCGNQGILFCPVCLSIFILITHLIWFFQSLDLNAHHLATIQSLFFPHCKQMHQ